MFKIIVFLKKKNVVALLLSALFSPLFNFSAAAQNNNILTSQVILPSPEATSIARHVAYPVGLYTGQPVIDIPVCAIKGRDIVYPVSLRYHPGNKGSYSNSSLGRGWSVDGVGLITRVVNGISDFDVNGYIGSQLPENLDVVTSTFINEAAGATRDTGPDLFYFNFAGHSGKFMFTPTGELISDPSYHLKIEPLSNEDNFWVIYDDSGYKYIFGEDGARETTDNSVGNNIVTSWYLSKIISPLKETVKFTYRQPRNQYNKAFGIDTLTGIFTSNQSQVFPQYQLKTPHYYAVPHLSKIEILNGEYARQISFGYQTLPSNSELLQSISLSAGTLNGTSYSWLTLSNCRLFYTGGNPYILEHVQFFQANASESVSACKISYQTDGDQLLSQMEYSSGRKVKYFYEAHDLSALNLNSNIISQLDFGVRLDKIQITGQETRVIEYGYLDAAGSPSTQLMTGNVPALTYISTRWIKDTSFILTEGTITRNNIIPLFSQILGSPLVTYNSVSTESAQKGKVLTSFTNVPSGLTATVEGYYSQAFLNPLYNLDFRNGKPREREVFKKVNNTWFAIEKTEWLYESFDRPGLKGINLLFPDAASNGNILDAVNAINGDANTSLNYKDITGMQSYTVPTTWSRLYETKSTIAEDPGVSRTTNTSYEYTASNSIRSQTVNLADGTKLRTTFTYPFDYTSIPVLDEMQQRNMNSYGIETFAEQMVPPSTTYSLLSGNISQYEFFPDSDPGNDLPDLSNENILIKSSYGWEKEQAGTTATSAIPSLSTRNYQFLSAYQYDNDGFLLQSETKGGELWSLIWDKASYQPVAKAVNASAGNIYYNGFEKDGTPGLAKTGLKSSGGSQFTVPFIPQSGFNYLMTYWYYQNGEWHYREKDFMPEINEGEALDEIRVFPKEALMVSAALDNKGKTINQTDQNGQSQYYEYDGYDRIENIKDNEGNILRSYDYYNSKIPECDVSNSVPIAANFKYGDEMVMNVDQEYDIIIQASGGCGTLSYKWYYIDENNEESYLGETSVARLSMKPPCNFHFSIKCEITDKGGPTYRYYENM